MTIPIWKQFEIECTDYLNRKFGAYAHFEHQGEEDSTRPDIFVETKSGNSFYIDAKHSPAQCGQFVLLENILTEQFEYSRRNANRINIYSEKIMQYMNEHYEQFRNADTSGKNIIMPDGESIFSNWIIDTYKKKGTHFFITNDCTILPIERFKTYFTSTAKYRVKKSGSSPIGKTRLSKVKSFIETCNYPVSNFRIEGKKLFVTSSSDLNHIKFRFEQYQYMFSQRNHEYEIRKLSNTNHANVIFSITKKDGVEGLSDSDFISKLQ
ncbi:hypothetical protein [Frisingicoccus sp.]|uniref:hypothetical protein n=1 Tax=Frisingicoccus sp. TaxID=1918627 RepID=UPI002EC6669F|nr:hypothetical protein [Frisingicoccus sp.]